MPEYTQEALMALIEPTLIRQYIKPYDAAGLAERARIYYEFNLFYSSMSLLDFVEYMQHIEDISIRRHFE